MKRYAFVVPRFGKSIAGGAEHLAGELARALAKRGDSVDILTTCAVDNRTWENVLPVGVSNEDNLSVYRFPVSGRDLEKWIPLQLAIHGGQTVSIEEQLDWMSHSVTSVELFSYIERESASYDALFFAPYLFGTTFWGSLIDPDRSILIPCLHDESYAYQEVIASMFRQVRGCVFNAQPERDLADRLYGKLRGGVVGMGLEIPESDIQPTASEPYILYLGRKETGKNAHLLVDYFVAAKDRGLLPRELQLRIVGGGSFSDLGRPSALNRDDIVDLAHVTEEEKIRLIKGACYLCQPSVNESFSIVIMEAWRVNVPVVVHADCAVTRHHVVESGGGLYFSTIEDFVGVTRRFLEDPTLRQTLGASGCAYVAREYSWKRVMERFDLAMQEIFADSERVPVTGMLN